MRTHCAHSLSRCGSSLALTSFAAAAELVMVDLRTCTYCAKFRRRGCADLYATEAGKVAPLRRVSPLKRWPDDLAAIRPARLHAGLHPRGERPRNRPLCRLLERREVLGAARSVAEAAPISPDSARRVATRRAGSAPRAGRPFTGFHARSRSGGAARGAAGFRRRFLCAADADKMAARKRSEPECVL